MEILRMTALKINTSGCSTQQISHQSFARAIHKEVPIVVRCGIDAGSDWIDYNATEGADGIWIVNKETKRFILLRLPPETS
ncbi:hypothetical protein ACTXT7_001019 [Hymenolepis weldensis]